jgi:hypothetical protein
MNNLSRVGRLAMDSPTVRYACGGCGGCGVSNLGRPSEVPGIQHGSLTLVRTFPRRDTFATHQMHLTHRTAYLRRACWGDGIFGGGPSWR